MRVLGLDFETTVVDPFDATKMRITEIGAILWCTKENKPLEILSQSVWADDYVWHPLMQEITGLTEAEHKEFGVSPISALHDLFLLMEKAEAVVAHNGKNFDKVVLECEVKRHAMESVYPSKHWIDTIADVPYGKRIETRKLEFLGPSHGFLNPFSHRAIFDVLTMLKVMGQYDFEKVLARSKEPDVLVRAVISPPFGNTKAKGEKEVAEAKVRGFKFDGTNKIWVKRIKESEYTDEVAACAWLVVVVKK